MRLAKVQAEEASLVPFSGDIAWHTGPDPERPGFHIATGYPGGLDGFYILVQDIGDSLWGWLLMNGEQLPVQMRNGYANEQLAKTAVAMWLEVNPNG